MNSASVEIRDVWKYYGDYPALYALGIPTAVNAPAVRRARGRGFAMLSLVGMLAFGLTVVIAWLTL